MNRQAQPSKTLVYAAALTLAAAVVAGGWVFTWRMTEYGHDQERQNIAVLASVAASSLDHHLIAQLRGVPEDEGTETFAKVRRQLRRIRDAIPHIRFVYLVTRRDDQIVFLADAEPSDSADYSPPGQIYSEAPDAFQQAFAGAGARAYGPHRDRWGEWITGIAAVPQPNGNVVLAVLGADISAEHYQDTVANYRNFALAITVLIAAIVALSGAMLAMMWRYNNRLQSNLDEIKQAQERLQLAAAVIEHSSEGVMVMDDKLRIESVNPAFERITGYTAAGAVGHTPRILFSGKHDDNFFNRLHEMVDKQGHWRGEIWNRRRSGELYPQETSINALRDATGQIKHYASVFSDNTDQNRLETKLREMSLVDGLTGVGNRRMFDETLAREWARALRDGAPLSLLMADIDYFKRYNDHYGHLEGDRCLQEVAQALQKIANRASDVVARYGGEEFAVILPGADATAAAAMGERIRAGVAGLALPHSASDAAAFVTISVGVATTMPLQAGGQAELIGAADRALYQAKRSGRNGVVSAANAAAA